MTPKITIRGKTYDLTDPNDLAKVQADLVPANWPGTKKDCVRLFIASRAMLAAQLDRLLAYNWKNISKIAQEESAEGSPARVAVNFGFEVDQSAPTVAALSSLKLSYSAKFTTKAKPQTRDINQGDLFAEEAPLNLDDLNEPEPEPEAPAEEKKAEDGKVVPIDGKKPRKRRGKKDSPEGAPGE